MRRREFLTTTALSGSGLLLAACTPRAVAPPGVASNAAQAPATATSPAATVNPSGLTGTVTYWHTFTSQSEMDGLAKVTRAFKDKYPNVVVNSENVPNSDFMAKFSLAVQGGGKPETTMMSNIRLPDMVTMGGLIDLSSRIATWDQRQYLPDERFADATINGRIYGVPSFAFVNWMYYRADWFKEAGIAPPKTFDDFQSAAIKLSDPSRNRFGFGLRGAGGGEAMLIEVMRSFGSPIVDDKGQPAMHRQNATDAVQ
jgi:multiple sugar transport system substrate-binding protein